MSTSPRLFCLDTVMIDVVVSVRSLPASGADVLASGQLLATGGGYNAMSAAARQGLPAVYAGRLGTGPLSSLALASFERDGITAPIVANREIDNGFCVVFVEAMGERTFVTARGAEATLRSSDLDDLDVGSGDVVLVSGYNVLYADSASFVLEWLGALPTSTIVAFDPSNRVLDIARAHLDAAMSRCDWLVCNAVEASLMSGAGTTARAATKLAEQTQRGNVIVRHGATGCTVIERGSRPVAVKGFSTTVVDTNGAGDVHSGVFFAELSHGTSVVASALRANAAAALSIAHLGPGHGPSREVVTQFMAT